MIRKEREKTDMDDAIQERYAIALETLMTKVQADPYILAAVLLGSLAHDTVWERSDIDILLVTQETRLKREGICLVEEGVNIHCFLTTRSGFRQVLEGSVQGSFMHSLLVKGKMLFSREEPLVELFEARLRLSERDRAIRLLGAVSNILPVLTKAEKWFHIKRDLDYCSFWILKCVDSLAMVEVLLNNEIPGREVVHQAMRYNPALFQAVYTDLLHGQATEESLRRVLEQIRAYLHTHAALLFEPLFTYLREEGELRSVTDLNHHFNRHFQIENVETPCEWLADEGLLQKLAAPTRLTDRGKVSVEEAAYYFAES